MSSVVIIGAGYVGQRVVPLLQNEDVEVYVTTRQHKNDRGKSNNDAYVSKHFLDLDQSDSDIDLDWLPNSFSVLYSAPPSTQDYPDHHDHRVRKFLHCLGDHLPSRIVYISTTGVYGDANGEWVDETSNTNPNTDRGKRRLDAEQQLQAWCKQRDIPWVILRVAAIYGPGRLGLEALKNRTGMIRADQAPPGNRIHADDLAHICLRALRSSICSRVFNASDGNPIPRIEFCRLVALHAGLPEPVAKDFDEVWAGASPAQRSFLRGARKVSNQRLRNELGVTLRYSDVETGIIASLVPDKTP
ncbi:MAG: SDR family oxidoreductase [Gammaproteobacteria bacterium]|nr:SDR family oxidoreductase [Gammaproteobacteria bacterium]